MNISICEFENKLVLKQHFSGLHWVEGTKVSYSSSAEWLRRVTALRTGSGEVLNLPVPAQNASKGLEIILKTECLKWQIELGLPLLANSGARKALTQESSEEFRSNQKMVCACVIRIAIIRTRNKVYSLHCVSEEEHFDVRVRTSPARSLCREDAAERD